MNIGIIGGDLRIIRLAEMYAKENDKVYTYGLEKYSNLVNQGREENLNIDIRKMEMNNKTLQENIDTKQSIKRENIIKCNNIERKMILCDSIKEVITNAEIIISSMPFSKDGVYINAPFSKEKIKIEDLEKDLVHAINNKRKMENEKNTSIKTLRFIAGGIPKEFLKEYDITKNEKECIYLKDDDNQPYEKFKTADIKIIDLLESERLTILNAMATVEGTIKIAIQEREETIFESNVLVCGFGRIGKIMCDRFRALGANVYCTARKEKDLTWIREKRYIPLTYDKVAENGEKFDLVINTVPTLVLKEKELNSFKQDVLIIDVASNPGGIDKDYAMQKNIKVITALGIPGKEMPKTAAKFIKEEILTF